MTLATLFTRQPKLSYYRGERVAVTKNHAPGPDGEWTTVEFSDGRRFDVPSFLIEWK